MELHFQPMDRINAQRLLMWQYPPPYAMYSFAPSNDNLAFLNDPTNGYYAITAANNEFVAYRCFGTDAQVPGGDYHADALDTGGGLRPDLTGRGLGLHFMNAGLAFGMLTFAPRAFRITVAAFNQRALVVAARAGFVPVQQFARPSDGRAFVVLLRDAAEHVVDRP